MKVNNPKGNNKINLATLKKALSILTPEEKREFIQAILSNKNLEKPSHQIILSPKLKDKLGDIPDIPAIFT